VFLGLPCPAYTLSVISQDPTCSTLPVWSVSNTWMTNPGTGWATIRHARLSPISTESCLKSHVGSGLLSTGLLHWRIGSAPISGFLVRKAEVTTNYHAAPFPQFGIVSLQTYRQGFSPLSQLSYFLSSFLTNTGNVFLRLASFLNRQDPCAG
jgi:hypothetical protein